MLLRMLSQIILRHISERALCLPGYTGWTDSVWTQSALVQLGGGLGIGWGSGSVVRDQTMRGGRSKRLCWIKIGRVSHVLMTWPYFSRKEPIRTLLPGLEPCGRIVRQMGICSPRYCIWPTKPSQIGLRNLGSLCRMGRFSSLLDRHAWLGCIWGSRPCAPIKPATWHVVITSSRSEHGLGLGQEICRYVRIKSAWLLALDSGRGPALAHSCTQAGYHSGHLIRLIHQWWFGRHRDFSPAAVVSFFEAKILPSFQDHTFTLVANKIRHRLSCMLHHFQNISNLYILIHLIAK